MGRPAQPAARSGGVDRRRSRHDGADGACGEGVVTSAMSPPGDPPGVAGHDLGDWIADHRVSPA